MSEEESKWAKLTRLFKNGPVIRHKIAASSKMYEPQGTARAYKKELSSLYVNSLASYGQYERLCIAGQTPVAIPGSEGFISIEDLAEKYPNGEKFLVYAYDHNKKKIVPAWGHHPRSSGVKKTVKITFDDGAHLICTPDHPCMMRDGTYRDAGDLNPADSMMPFYRKQFNGKRSDGKSFAGYRSVYTMEKQPKSWRGWESEHRLIAEWEAGRDIVKFEEHVHHIDHNPENNNQSNLEIVNAKEHLAEHGKQAIKQWADPVLHKKLQDGIQRAWDNDDCSRRAVIAKANREKKPRVDISFDMIAELAETNNYSIEVICKKLRCSNSVIFNRIKWKGYNTGQSWHNFIQEHFGVTLAQDKTSFSSYWAGRKRSKEFKDNRTGKNNSQFRADLTIEVIVASARANKFVQKSVLKELNCKNKILLSRIRQSDIKNWREFKHIYAKNHKIVSVEPYEEIETFDLTVEGYENFATDTIIVHNSRYADYCVTGDTLVLTEDGPKSIKKITEDFASGKKTSVYCIDKETCKTKCVEISNAKLTQKDDEIWEVEMTTGLIVRCNAQHPFMLATGEYIRTDELIEGMLLVPETIEQNAQIVKSAIKTDYLEDVYDITVPEIHNFAVCDKKCNNIIYLRNSEMEFTPELSSALDIFADETTSQNEHGQMVDIKSDNEEIKEVLETLFFDILNIEFNLHSWARNLVKYGDFILFVDASEENGILNMLPIPINEIEREEGYDPENPFAHRFRWLTQGNMILEAWQIIHFRLLGNDNFLPYGTSVIEAARRVWRQLILIEDAMLVYRIVRSPERRVFKIEVGNVDPTKIPAYMEQVKTSLKRNKIVNSQTGRVDLRYNPLSVDEDYFLPMRDGKGSQIESLPGGTMVGDIEDVQYIQSKLFSALKIPKSYLGYEEAGCFVPETKVALLDGRNLTMEEIREELKLGVELWTYSINTETGEMVPGHISVSSPTRKNAELVRVTLDNDKSFICTPDHKWLNRNCKYISAEDLKTGESLMPLYRRITGEDTGTRNLMGYEEVYDTNLEKWVYTHKMSEAWKYRSGHEIKSRRVIHHQDFDKRNNNPSNLIEMESESHMQLHRDHMNVLRKKWIADGKYSGWNNGWKNKTFKNIERLYDYNKLVRWCIENNPTSRRKIFKNYGLPEVWFSRLLDDKDITYKEFATMYISGGYKLSRKDTNGFKHPNYRREGSVSALCKDNNLASLWITNCNNCGNEFTFKPSISGRKYCSRECLDTRCIKNHKVKSVEMLDYRRDTWCITVDKWHNFSLEDGTIVKNSKATLAQEDVRFSRTIQRIQKIVISELNKIAVIHLYLLGYYGEDLVDYEIEMSNPSTIAEQQKLELWRLKLEIAGSAQEGMLDKTTVWKDLFGFSDEKIEQILDGQRADKLFQLEVDEMSLEPDEEEGMGPTGEVEGEDELPNSLGGDEPTDDMGDAPEELQAAYHPENDNELSDILELEPEILVDEFEIDVDEFDEEMNEDGDDVKGYNPGSEGNQAEISVNKGKNIFATGEDIHKIAFGTDKNALGDPFDIAGMNRAIKRPFSEAVEPDSALDYIKESIARIDKSEKNMADMENILIENRKPKKFL